MQSYDFQVVLDSPLETVFPIYIDVQRWCNRNVFGEIRWSKGEPWTAGSRLQIAIRTPTRTTVDQVVQHFTPYESVSYISHVLGITCETRVVFVRASGGKTSINVSMHLLGTLSRSLGFAIEPVITKATRNFFEEIRKECETETKRAAHAKSAGNV